MGREAKPDRGPAVTTAPGVPVELAYVEWFDSTVTQGVTARDELPGVSEMRACGMVVAEDDSSVTLALEHNTTADHFRSVITIPGVNIRRQRRFVPPV